MPMNAVVLGLQVVVDLEVTDPVVAGLLIAAQVPLINWTKSNMKADPSIGSPLLNLKAAGAAITGIGGFSYTDVNALTNALCTAIGLTDPVGKTKAAIVTQHYADTIAAYGKILPSGLIAFTGPAPPDPGPVTGTGKIFLDGDFTFYTALGLTDALSIATWTTFGNSLKLHLNTFGDVQPNLPSTGTMVNPSIGGNVTGLGVLA